MRENTITQITWRTVMSLESLGTWVLASDYLPPGRNLSDTSTHGGSGQNRLDKVYPLHFHGHIYQRCIACDVRSTATGAITDLFAGFVSGINLYRPSKRRGLSPLVADHPLHLLDRRRHFIAVQV